MEATPFFEENTNQIKFLSAGFQSGRRHAKALNGSVKPAVIFMKGLWLDAELDRRTEPMRLRCDALLVTRLAGDTQNGLLPPGQSAGDRMRRGLSALALLLLASGCSAGWLPSSARAPSEAEQLVARADALAVKGWDHAARALYERVLREYPGDPASASALYNLGRLQVDPTSGFRNYRAAHATFSRLLTDFPKSRWEADARAWRATLSDLLAREEEATRLKPQLQGREEEATRLKRQLQWREEEATRLKLQVQLREEETSGLKAQIQQLRRVDLNLERRR